MNIRIPLPAGALAAAALAGLALLAACGQRTPAASAGESAAAAAAGADAAAGIDPAGGELTPSPTNEPVVPAIVPPAEVADPQEPPSYEVAIASAAAVHNKALERCKTQPEAVQSQCEQEANAAFTDAQAKVQDLRGNKE